MGSRRCHVSCKEGAPLPHILYVYEEEKIEILFHSVKILSAFFQQYGPLKRFEAVLVRIIERRLFVGYGIEGIQQ